MTKNEATRLQERIKLLEHKVEELDAYCKQLYQGQICASNAHVDFLRTQERSSFFDIFNF